MGQWIDARREALFKKTDDGFVFKFGKEHVLVDEAQKAEIQKLDTQGWGLVLMWVPLGMIQLGSGIMGHITGKPDAPVKFISGLWIMVALVLVSLRGPQQLLNKKHISPLSLVRVTLKIVSLGVTKARP
jgi:hypothetical protein